MSHSHRAVGGRIAHHVDRGRHRERPDRKRVRRIGGMATGFIGAALITGTVAYAIIQAIATNETPQNVATGTLSLTMSSTSPSAGVSTGITGLMPGDVVNRYVTLTNGAIDAQDLTLGVSTSATNRLATDGTYGLKIAVTGCTQQWAAGSCPTGSGATQTNYVTPSSLYNFGTKTMISGAVPNGQVMYLQLQVSLPDQSETTSNGTPTLGSSSIQGLTAGLTWTFTENQRTAVTSNG